MGLHAMNLNLFRVLTPAEQEAQQQYIDRQKWRAACTTLGATAEQLDAYETRAREYAITTPYPNTRIVAEARRAALESLAQGDGIPEDIEEAVQSIWARDLARLLGLR
jgi:hypothetical protein